MGFPQIAHAAGIYMQTLLVRVAASSGLQPNLQFATYIHIIYTFLMKTAISIRLDQEVMDWFRAQRQRGYQTCINEVLRAHVRKQQERAVAQVTRAQELFRRYHARCFWHYTPDLQITSENLHLVWEGLRLHGGREGFQLAAELCGSAAPEQAATPNRAPRRCR